MERELQAARRGRRRLVAAGWLLVAGGLLVALASDVLLPFFAPFGLAAGALTMLAGGQLVRLRTPAAAIAAAAFTLLAGIGAGIAALGGSPAGGTAAALAAGMVGTALPALAILWIDADHLPSAGATDE